MIYQLTSDPDTVIRLPDGATVPRFHRFWDEYQQWLVGGGESLPAVIGNTSQIDIDPQATARTWRDQQLAASQWLVDRDRDEQAAGTPMSLSTDQYHELLDFRQDLRDWPLNSLFPEDISKPVVPAWLKTMAGGT